VRIIKRLRDGIKIRVEYEDDLYYLYNLIKEGDVVRGLTSREKDERTDRIRPEKKEKIKMEIDLRVEKTRFQPFSSDLRASGTIEGGEFDGRYQTLGIGVGDEVTLKKEVWKAEEIERLNEAVALSKMPSIVCIAIDDESCTIALVRRYGVQELATIRSDRTGKSEDEKEYRRSYYGSALTHLKGLEGDEIAVVGPGFEKEHLFTFLKERGFKVHIESASSAGMAGVTEAIKRGVIERIGAKDRVSEEMVEVENLLEEIAKGGKVAYGVEEVEKAVELGACEKLLMTDELFRTARGEDILRKNRGARGKFIIISTHHEGGKKLKAIGEVGALLRYRLNSP
jgi:protein pelota